MDFLKKGADLLNKNKTHNTGTTTTTDQAGAAGAPGQPAAQKQDYGDKAIDFFSKKSGRPVDAKTNEAIGDGARGLYEKFTGKKVDPKYSN